MQVSGGAAEAILCRSAPDLHDTGIGDQRNPRWFVTLVSEVLLHSKVVSRAHSRTDGGCGPLLPLTDP